jgi:hypothetical protein
VQQAAKKRQQMLDGIMISNTLHQRQQAEQENERQRVRDMQAADAAALGNMLKERTYNDTQKRQGVLDERWEADQRQKSMDRADANAYRYQDAELRRQEEAEERAFRAREAEAQRANARRLAEINMSGRGGAAEKPPTQGQLTADTFHARARAASEVIDEIEDTAGVDTWNGIYPNFWRSEEGQAYAQAQNQWIEAYLRKDSGAAIGKEEYANAARSYFPQPGDNPKTLARKRKARGEIENSLAIQGTGRSRSTGAGPNTGSGGRSKYQISVED